MQKEIVRKLDLELLLAQFEPNPVPRPDLEQYTIPADTAATILYIAAYTYGDIIGKTVLDLGCGTGRLALGAAFLGAGQVVGVDIDRHSIKAAFENGVKADLKSKAQWIAADINCIHGHFDTVLQNPPYGVQKREADRKFLEKALETGGVIYSLHKSLHDDIAFVKTLKANRDNFLPVSPSPFLKKFIEGRGGRIRVVQAMVMTIPHMFDFHTKRKHEFAVDLYIIERKK